MSSKSRQQLLQEIHELEQQIGELKAELSEQGSASPRTVIVPKEMEPLFHESEKLVNEYFSSIERSPEKGTIEIQGERYVLVRASALSFEFFNSIKSQYANRGEDEAFKIGQNFLFDIGHVLGIEDAHRFHQKMKVSDPIAKLSAGPINFAYSGWAKVEILEESNPSPDANFFLKYHHPYSFEADAWIKEGIQSEKPVCIMNAAYSSGWCETSFGIPLTAVEVTCRAKGDDHCTFIMAPPHRIEDYLEDESPERVDEKPSFDIPLFFERKMVEEHINASLEEKEILLKEIHHRVKNNLQVIVSLMGLQIMTTQNNEAKAILRYSQSRVKTMGMIHEMLYQSEDLARVSYREYIGTLFKALMRTYSINPANVELVVDMDDYFFGIDTAIPLGLILNELVTNALKYAFPEDRLGVITVQLKETSHRHFELHFSDDGIGLAEVPDFENSETLGYKLINILTSQLDGEVQAWVENGSHFKINFVLQD